jgi:hypothetical protein
MIGLRVYLLLCMAVFLTELILFSPPLVQQHNAGQGRLLLYVSRSHTHWLTTVCRTLLDAWSTRRRGNTQHSQETDIHDSGGIRTRNPSKRAVANPRPRLLHHWDRYYMIQGNGLFCYCFLCCVLLFVFCLLRTAVYVCCFLGLADTGLLVMVELGVLITCFAPAEGSGAVSRLSEVSRPANADIGRESQSFAKCPVF